MPEIRTYTESECVVFMKTKDEYGMFSNFASGFPLSVNGKTFYTSEALYQCFKYTHHPDIQQKIATHRNPFYAKKEAWGYKCIRDDWDRCKIPVMYWCISLKLYQYTPFQHLLLGSEGKQIVEKSYRDEFWGARPQNDGTLIGINALGRLLMKLREEYKEYVLKRKRFKVEKPDVKDFKLFGKTIFVT